MCPMSYWLLTRTEPADSRFDSSEGPLSALGAMQRTEMGDGIQTSAICGRSHAEWSAMGSLRWDNLNQSPTYHYMTRICSIAQHYALDRRASIFSCIVLTPFHPEPKGRGDREQRRDALWNIKWNTLVRSRLFYFMTRVVTLKDFKRLDKYRCH